MAIRHGEKIEPAPNRPIAALPHPIEIRVYKMIDRNGNFQDTSAIRALKNSFRHRLVAAFRTTQLVKQAHASAQSLAYFSRSSQHSTIPSLQHSNSIKSFAARPRLEPFPTPLPNRRRRTPPRARRPESQYKPRWRPNTRAAADRRDDHRGNDRHAASA